MPHTLCFDLPAPLDSSRLAPGLKRTVLSSLVENSPFNWVSFCPPLPFSGILFSFQQQDQWGAVRQPSCRWVLRAHLPAERQTYQMCLPVPREGEEITGRSCGEKVTPWSHFLKKLTLSVFFKVKLTGGWIEPGQRRWTSHRGHPQTHPLHSGSLHSHYSASMYLIWSTFP